jgi:hypothetical protein
MRLMSFLLTPGQLVDGSKTETRRVGWADMKVGEHVQACRKVQGRKRGEPLDRLCVIEVLAVRREPLDTITADAVRREGLPGMTPAAFVAMFCEAMGCAPDRIVTVIEFRRVEPLTTGQLSMFDQLAEAAPVVVPRRRAKRAKPMRPDEARLELSLERAIGMAEQIHPDHWPRWLVFAVDRVRAGDPWLTVAVGELDPGDDPKGFRPTSRPYVTSSPMAAALLAIGWSP